MSHAHLNFARRTPDALLLLLSHAVPSVRLGALERLGPHLDDAAVRLVIRGLADVDPDRAVRDRSKALLRATQ